MPENIPTPAGFTGKDITGQRYGRLTAFEFSHWHELPSGQRVQMWKCRCDCGSIIVAVKGNLNAGQIKSCGCFQKERARITQTKHGHAARITGQEGQSKTYRAWRGMKERCLRHKDYTGRKITICDRWSHSNSFQNFLKDMGMCPPGLTLHRVDNNGPYSPENCIWADYVTQNNCRRSSRWEIAFGKTKTIAQWAREYSLKYERLLHWTNRLGIEQALTKMCGERIKAMS